MHISSVNTVAIPQKRHFSLPPAADKGQAELREKSSSHKRFVKTVHTIPICVLHGYGRYRKIARARAFYAAVFPGIASCAFSASACAGICAVICHIRHSSILSFRIGQFLPSTYYIHMAKECEKSRKTTEALPRSFYNYMRHLFLYSSGVMPVCFLNCFIKSTSLPYPSFSEMRFTENAVESRSCFAYSVLLCMMSAVGGTPKHSLYMC